MRGTDWLRRKAATKPVPAMTATVYSDSVTDPSMPGRLDVGGVVIAYAASGMARVLGNAEDRRDANCPCTVIYSRCYYGH